MAVKITKLALDRTSKKLIISAEASEEDEYMTTLYIDTQKTFVCKNEPSSSATKIDLNPETLTESAGTVTIKDSKVKKITNYEVELDKITSGAASVFDWDKDILFVFLDDITGDVIDYVVSVAFDQIGFFNDLFQQIHKDTISTGCCDSPQRAADIALMFEAFQLALLIEDFRQVIYYWEELHITDNTSIMNKCSCK